jgi:hypothetical protein
MLWISRRQPFMRHVLTRLAFIDDTSLQTNLARTTGWSPCGGRLVDHVPSGHRQTQTFATPDGARPAGGLAGCPVAARKLRP